MDLDSISRELEAQGIGVETLEKWQRLTRRLQLLDTALIAYSGGVDSTFLAYAAFLVMGERACAVYVHTGVESAAQNELAERWAAQIGFCFKKLEHSSLQNPNFTANPPERCYICKLSILNFLKKFADEHGYKTILEGQNMDDQNDYRPGRRAVLETGTLSPLSEAGLAKSEIRALARALNLPVWNQPSSPCLATRFPYHTGITREGLQQVERAEDFLMTLGFTRVRVRVHQELARIEVDPAEISALLNQKDDIIHFFKEIGFLYVSVDLQGYRQGSLNEGLNI